MAFLSNTGLNATDIYTNLGRVILSHPTVPHSLVLYGVADESGFQPAIDGWRKAEGRSSRGGIRIAGGYQAPIEELVCTYYVTQQQIRLFDWLKRAQDNSQVPITLQDWMQVVTQIPGNPAPNWLPGYPIVGVLGINEGKQSYPVWIDTDKGYKSYASGTCWSVLQFQALREA
jgi:hypothetical protein